MDDCIFCKIVRNELPAYKLHENDSFLAILDLYPNTEGYTLIITKKHYQRVWDVENIGEYFEFTRELAKHFQKVTNTEAIYSMILGEEIPHAHIRLIPDEKGIFISEVSEFINSMKERGLINKLDDNQAKTIQNKFKLR